MGIATSIADTIQNLVSGLGTERDKSSASEYIFSPLTYHQLLTAYRGSWLPRKIVRIPADDAVRKWRTWSAEREQTDAIEKLEVRLGVRQKIHRGLVLARLMGGAAVYYSVRGQTPSQPLDLERVGRDSLESVTVFTNLQLSAGDVDRDLLSDHYGLPREYTLTDEKGGLVQIHPSRIVRLCGAEPLDSNIDGISGWGDSVLQAVYWSLLQCDQTTANIASLIFEAKQDVVNIPGFMGKVEDRRWVNKLITRFTLANQMKGINGTLILDEKETFSQKSASFAGLPDVMDRFAQNVSGAADIPMTRLWGRSPAGMNSTGESDLKNYYDAVQTHQEIVLTPAMSNLNEVLIRSALGSRPSEIYPIWDSLWQTTEKERAEVGKTKAEMIKILADSGLFPQRTLAEASANTMVETGAVPGLDAAVEEFGLEPEEPTDDDLVRAALGVAAGAATPAQERATASAVADATPRSLYVRRDVLNGAEIVRWAQSQGIRETLSASDLHVTIAFSREPVDWMKIGESWEDRLEIAAGGPRQLEFLGENQDALVLLIPGRSLRWRHQEIVEAGASWDFPEYQPHITLSYSPGLSDLSGITPYRGRIVLGPEIFEEVDEGARERLTGEKT